MKKIMMAAVAALTAFTAVPVSEVQAQSVRVVIGDRDRDRCTVRRVRTVRPSGRVVIRDERICRPSRFERRRDDCRVRQVRTFRDGRYITRTTRTCR